MTERRRGRPRKTGTESQPIEQKPNVAERQRTMVTLLTQLKVIIKDLDLAADMNPTDPRGYTSLDVDQALLVVMENITDRLSRDPNEHKGDENQEYSRLWTSITEEVKDSLMTLFQQHLHGRTRYSRFITDFNRLILSRIIAILRLHTPAEAKTLLPFVIARVRNELENISDGFSDALQQGALQRLRQHNTVVDMSPRPVGRLSDHERLKLIDRAVSRVQYAAE